MNDYPNSLKDLMQPNVAGVYAILGHDNKVYIGESAFCWWRNTLVMAAKLGLSCGIIRELPGSSMRDRRRHERAVAELFASRGFTIVSEHGNAPKRAKCHPDRDWHKYGLCLPCYRAQRRRNKRPQRGTRSTPLVDRVNPTGGKG